MRILFRLLKYLFPKRPLRDKIPLKARGYASATTIYGIPPERLITLCRALVAANCAKDERQAYMILKNEPVGTPLKDLIRKYKRPRRFRHRLVTAAIRFKRILWVIMVCLWFVGLESVGAQDSPKGEALSDLEVHACPKPACEIIGEIAAGGRFVISGQGGGWIYFLYWDQDGWVKYSPEIVKLNVELEDIPEIITKTVMPLRVESWSIDPLQPAPGQPYTIALQIKADQDVPASALGVLFPGGEFVYLPIPAMPTGTGGTIKIPAKGEPKTGNQEIVIILDIDQQMTPEPDEAQRLIIPIRIDKPYRVQGTLTLKGATTIDLEGGAVDLQWDGAKLSGKIAVLTDLGAAHFDALVRMAQNEVDEVQPGLLLGVTTAEGSRGILRIMRVGDELEVFYALY